MANSAAVAKARAVYGTLFKKEDYENLIHRNSVSTAVSYLKGTPRYGAVFSGYDGAALHRGQIEQLLGKSVFESYLRIRRFSSGSPVMDFYLKEREAEQLSKAIAAVAAGTQERFYLSFPDYLMDRVGFDPKTAAQAKNGRALLAAIRGMAYEKPLTPFLSGEELDLNRCVTAVHACLLSWTFTELNKSCRGKERERLKSFFLRRADSENLLICYRLKRFFDEDSERIRTLILPYRYRVKPREIDDALSAQNPTEALLRLLSERCISRNIAVEEDSPETGIARGNYEYFRHRLALASNEIEALYALMILLDTERTNLQKIIEGIRYSIPPQEIEKFIIV